MSLPPLPAPDWLERKGFLFEIDSDSVSNRSATELVEMSKVQAYGQQCRDAALEEAAESLFTLDIESYGILPIRASMVISDCNMAIRKLK